MSGPLRNDPGSSRSGPGFPGRSERWGVWGAISGPPITSEQRRELCTDHLVGEGADMLGADRAVARDEERLRHAVDAVVHRDLAAAVARVGKGEAEVADELAPGLVGVLDVDADHDHAALAVRAPGALEHRRLVVARGVAPRRPQVQDDHLAPERGEIDGRA